MFLSVGARIGYFQGDVKKLVDDISTLRPTLFIGVPCACLPAECCFVISLRHLRISLSTQKSLFQSMSLSHEA